LGARFPSIFKNDIVSDWLSPNPITRSRDLCNASSESCQVRKEAALRRSLRVPQISRGLSTARRSRFNVEGRRARTDTDRHGSLSLAGKQGCPTNQNRQSSIGSIVNWFNRRSVGFVRLSLVLS